jgi:hypothetical protein
MGRSRGIYRVSVALRLAIFLVITQTFSAEPQGRRAELQYYRNEFEAQYKYPVYDTLFEKIIWERKVSHLVMEFQNDEYRVTLLMMQEYPYNYKSHTYPIHYAFKTFGEAAEKFESLNHFLRNNGVMAVGLNGKKIVRERILVEAKGSAPPRPHLEDWPGNKDTDPILTREKLPRRLPLKIGN